MKSTRTITVILFLLASFELAGTCYSQEIPEEARKHYVRGQTAIEMIESEVDYADVVLEFETAIQLAPAWADPHYDLGMFQDKIGKYDDAISHLKKYLELAPQAPNASQVQSQIYKIEFKKEKTSDKQMMIDLIVNGKKSVIGSFRGGMCYPADFYLKADEIFVDINCASSAQSYGQTVPVMFDGTTLSFTYYNYVCPTATALDMWPCEERIEMVGTVTSKNPLRFDMKQKVTLTKTEDSGNNYEGVWEFTK
ncbi:MAG: hypothetical protein A2W93_05815 [Bacteroidetes bacterium GWF2_43_63]|nr:MAG: hypothetical protein A2W94_04310 [Bacteroidetes bacterium GWE2_42_42]OFY55936.1 MAG: hypothetical protein A2W93_05815 [Bacteroidetes bacterium GWF2_43_63]HCB61084.1 hypothetical protein [Bacteroidales bacterium]HCY22264.1 hypothetical protein [Bacteroidales bacterium]